MARALRLQYQGAVYHITGRGNGRQKVYLDRESRKKFLEILGQTLLRFTWRCHAYCLMDNHYHLIIETLEPNLSHGMRHLNSVYTQWFNRNFKRVGHVFQGRFKAIVVEKGSHALELCRYVVLNPVRAKMVERPGDFRWSSYGGTVGYRHKLAWLDTAWVLGQFGENKTKAVGKYKEYVLEGIGQKESPWERLAGQIYFGSEQFIKGLKIRKEQEEEPEHPRGHRKPGRKELREMVKEGSGEEILRAVKEGHRQVEIARHLGVHYSLVSKKLKEAEKVR